MEIKRIEALWDATNWPPSATRRRFRTRLLVDYYLEKPASFFRIYRNNASIRDVISRLVVLNIGPLHIALEILKQRRDLKGEKTHEFFDKTASGDG